MRRNSLNRQSAQNIEEKKKHGKNVFEKRPVYNFMLNDLFEVYYFKEQEVIVINENQL